jgi:hypothetical protein
VSHKGIRSLIETTAKSLGDDIQFTYARTSDFNAMRDKRYPFIALDTLSTNSQFAVNNSYNYSKTWLINMAFYGLDNRESIGDDYKKILDDMDVLVDGFITKLNVTTQDSAGLLITAINQVAFVKTTDDILTGFLLSFSITVPDNWNYCDGC